MLGLSEVVSSTAQKWSRRNSIYSEVGESMFDSGWGKGGGDKKKIKGNPRIEPNAEP